MLSLFYTAMTQDLLQSLSIVCSRLEGSSPLSFFLPLVSACASSFYAERVGEKWNEICPFVRLAAQLNASPRVTVSCVPLRLIQCPSARRWSERRKWIDGMQLPAANVDGRRSFAGPLFRARVLPARRQSFSRRAEPSRAKPSQPVEKYSWTPVKSNLHFYLEQPAPANEQQQTRLLVGSANVVVVVVVIGRPPKPTLVRAPAIIKLPADSISSQMQTFTLSTSEWRKEASQVDCCLRAPTNKRSGPRKHEWTLSPPIN